MRRTRRWERVEVLVVREKWGEKWMKMMKGMRRRRRMRMRQVVLDDRYLTRHEGEQSWKKEFPSTLRDLLQTVHLLHSIAGQEGMCSQRDSLDQRDSVDQRDQRDSLDQRDPLDWEVAEVRRMMMMMMRRVQRT